MDLGDLALLWLLTRGLSPAGKNQPALPVTSEVPYSIWPLSLPASQRRWSLAGLHPEAAPHFRALVAEATARGWSPRMADATRTPEEQAYEVRSKSSKVECSWHLGGRAVDLELHGAGLTYHPDYAALGEWWANQGGVWGGTFARYGLHGDFRHFEYHPGIRSPKDAGLCVSTPGAIARYWQGQQR